MWFLWLLTAIGPSDIVVRRDSFPSRGFVTGARSRETEKIRKGTGIGMEGARAMDLKGNW